jgi:hypothetical protein
MPGKGFDKWDYKNIALLFFQKYYPLSYEELFRKFEAIVEEIIEIVEKEACAGNLDKPGIWEWCTLRSGKQWPLSKWVRVNTVAQYKRTTRILLHTLGRTKR